MACDASNEEALPIIDPAIKYCDRAPSFSAFFVEKGGKSCHCLRAGSRSRKRCLFGVPVTWRAPGGVPIL
jgi:hypothetical protein